jgi:hypothetical protein
LFVAVFDAGAFGGLGAAGGLFLLIEFGSPTSGAVSAPGWALKYGSSANQKRLAVITAGN